MLSDCAPAYLKNKFRKYPFLTPQDRNQIAASSDARMTDSRWGPSDQSRTYVVRLTRNESEIIKLMALLSANPANQHYIRMMAIRTRFH